MSGPNANGAKIAGVKIAPARFGRLPPGLSFRHPAAWLATWFGVGLAPIAPGTWGSAAALPLAALIHWQIGRIGLAVAALILFLIGAWAAEIYARRTGVSDPGQIVIDEVAGQWVALCTVPLDWRYYLAGFVLFRIADIVKPYPANWADRSLKGGVGVMLDDMIAGGYCAIALELFRWLMR